jgi:hypothetical protein
VSVKASELADNDQVVDAYKRELHMVCIYMYMYAHTCTLVFQYAENDQVLDVLINLTKILI